jgi:hypothetical protein
VRLRLIKARGGLLGVRAKQGRRRTRSARAGVRLYLDRRGPPVIGCGAGEGEGSGLAELGRAGLASWAATRRA